MAANSPCPRNAKNKSLYYHIYVCNAGLNHLIHYDGNFSPAQYFDYPEANNYLGFFFFFSICLTFYWSGQKVHFGFSVISSELFGQPNMCLSLSNHKAFPNLSNYSLISFIYTSYSIIFIFLKKSLPKILTFSNFYELHFLPDSFHFLSKKGSVFLSWVVSPVS